LSFPKGTFNPNLWWDTPELITLLNTALSFLLCCPASDLVPYGTKRNNKIFGFLYQGFAFSWEANYEGCFGISIGIPLPNDCVHLMNYYRVKNNTYYIEEFQSFYDENKNRDPRRLINKILYPIRYIEFIFSLMSS
jgi:hypothetical protein